MADYVVKQGDTQPSFVATLAYADNTVVDLTGATVTLLMRSLKDASITPVTGPVTVLNPGGGVVRWDPAIQDTGLPGNFMAQFVVVFQGGSQMSFPTDGYLWFSVEPNLTLAPQRLVDLDDLKDYLSVQSTSRERDAKLLRFIDAVTPMIEQITGPIIPRVWEEWHDGGSNMIELRRRPSSGFGTDPVLDLIAASEYRGPIEYPLSLVASPVFGSIYSVFVDKDMGTITRRTAGGRTIAFMPGRQQIHVWYRAGQNGTPPNVYEATLELLRVNYQTTLQVGGARRTVADEGDVGPAMGYFMPRRVRDMLIPTRRAPSFA